MNLRLERQPSREGTTLGQLFVDGVRECETLEDQVREGAKVYGETAIPPGTYRVLLNRSTRFNRILPLILDVPGFLGIRIHSGNTTQDTEGCVLVGRYHTGAALEKSRDALDALMTKLAPVQSRGEAITITIEHASIEAQKA